MAVRLSADSVVDLRILGLFCWASITAWDLGGFPRLFYSSSYSSITSIACK